MPSSDCLENRFGHSCLRRNNNLNVMIGILFLSGAFILIEQSLSETIVVRHHKMSHVMKNGTLAFQTRISLDINMSGFHLMKSR